MRSPVPAWLASGLALLALPFLAFAQTTYPPLVVPAREVPVPSTVSPELQKLIAAPVPPPAPVPTTARGWKELQQEADAGEEKLARTAATSLGVKVEATEVAGVKCYRVTPREIAPRNKNDLIVHVHGGAYVFNAGVAGTGKRSCWPMPARCRCSPSTIACPRTIPFRRRRMMCFQFGKRSSRTMTPRTSSWAVRPRAAA